MHRMFTLAIARTLLGMVLAVFALVAHASDRVRGESIDEDPGGVTTAYLRTTAYEYALAMESWLRDALRASPQGLDPSVISRFQAQLNRATFAQFEYSYRENGQLRTRVYLAASGRDFRSFIVPGSGLVAPSATDTGYYREINPAVKFAETGVPDDSEVTPGPGSNPGRPNANDNDAEIKALQSIVRDISMNRVTTDRASIRAIVSRDICPSCARALARFADLYGVDIHITTVRFHDQVERRGAVWRRMRLLRTELAANLADALFPRAPRSVNATDLPPEDDLEDAHPARGVCGQSGS